MIVIDNNTPEYQKLMIGRLAKPGTYDMVPVVGVAQFHRATGALAIASTLAPGTAWQFESIRIHLSAAGGAGDLTATLDHGAGAAYDLVILTQDMTAVTDFVWHCERPMEFEKDDELDIAWANANVRTYGLEIIWKAR